MPLFDRSVSSTISIENQQGLELKDLKMSFQIRKTESSDPNTCTYSVWNLNEDSRSRINIKDSRLFLSAGYTQDTGEELIFTGNITGVGNSIARPNIVTKIEAEDGEKELNETRLAMSFKENVSIFQIIEKAIDALGLPVKTKEILEPLKKVKLRNGSAHMGTVKKLLHYVFLDQSLTWNIQNGELKIYENDSGDNSFAYVLTSGTGLLESPTKIKIKKGTRSSKKEVDGWRIRSLLLPKIEPGNILQVTSQDIPANSQFKVVNVDHSGDSLEGDFTTICEVIDIG